MEHVSGDARRTVEVVDGVHLTQLAAGESMSVQAFRIEPGATVPEHSHHHEQSGYVFQGTLTFTVDGASYPVGAGDGYAIPGDEPHAAANHGDTVVLGVDTFSPPRPNPDWAPDTDGGAAADGASGDGPAGADG